MNIWKPFRHATAAAAPQAAIVFAKFYIMLHLGEALDRVRKGKYVRLSCQGRPKGQKYTLLSPPPRT